MARLLALFGSVLVLGCTPGNQPLARPAHGGSGLSAASGAYRLSLVDAGGRALPAFGRGIESWVEGVLGQRYQVRIDNNTGRRVEAVITVDGKDVITGDPGSLDARGYIIEPYGHAVVDGFRTSMSGVAAFRFTTPGDSYAGRTGGGANIGVIGAAVFAEAAPKIAYRPQQPGPWWGADGRAEEKSAPAAAESEAGEDMDYAPRRSRGLGTQYGEQRYSPVSEVAFHRDNDAPSAVLAVYYDDREGLISRGIAPRPYPSYHGQPDPFPTADRRFAPPPR